MGNEIEASNIVWHHATVTRKRREAQNGHRSVIIWFTGLSSAGKSTLAHAVEERLHQQLYLEYGGEDNLKNEFLGIEYRGLGAIAQLMGLSLSLRRADLNLEYSNTVDDSHIWYETGIYKYRYRGYTIGHEVGGDADDLSFNSRFYMTPEVHLLTGLERERGGLDRNHSNRRVTYAGHLGLVYSILPDWEASVLYRYEQIDRPRFIKGEETNSHLITMHIAFHLLP